MTEQIVDAAPAAAKLPVWRSVVGAFCVIIGWTPDRDALLERFE